MPPKSSITLMSLPFLQAMDRTPEQSKSTIASHETVLSSGRSVQCQPVPHNDDGVMAEPRGVDPTVIVGMACRVPGATNTRELWQVLVEQTDLRRKMPGDRFNVDAFYHPQGANKGTTNARYGYFLDQDLSMFDNEFFRISGKEAESMDPQQRLLLEVVYEALENAGITLDEISGTACSVYCGSFSNDYNVMTGRDQLQYPKYSVTGSGNAILSNRISYCYNLHGPSMTIDTACSSSLMCFHLASQSLQNRECDMAIVAGSALHFDPNIFITMADFGMLSADGRCRTFDKEGSGYSRGEGICAVILKRQIQAELAGDTIRAVIRGTGANHDGLKGGLTLPNEKAQEDLLRRTYDQAGLSTTDTLYFEAHGTGTKVGDPREASAIGNVFGPDRTQPLIVGSVKSNLGHLEGASGLAGVIKATLSVESAKILPNMHFDAPNPEIDFSRLKIQVPTEIMDWKSEDGLRRASVNSFGYGGSNAHVILENYRPRSKPSDTSQSAMPGWNRPYLIPLSSHTEPAGKILINSLVSYISQHPQLKIIDLAHTLGSRRSMHRYRSFAIGCDPQTISEDLTEPKPLAKWTRTLETRPKIGFIFTGQGAQWHAMGRQLLDESPIFKDIIEQCDAILKRLPDPPNWSCVTELSREAQHSRLSQSRISQPVCAALQLALVEILQAWGIRPSAVVGHSSGEIVASYAAGLLSFDEAIICAYYRGLYMSKGVETADARRGAMIAAGLTEFQAQDDLRAYNGRLSLAAVNSPSSVTFSGDEDAIAELEEALKERKVFVRRLKVEQAFHSHHMIPLAPAFEHALSRILKGKRQAKCQLVSSVTARDSSARPMDAAYWAANMTRLVRFSEALTGMLLDDNDEPKIDVLVEIGPHPTLSAPAKEVMRSLKFELPYIASLNRNTPAFESLLAAAGQLFALGHPVDLERINGSVSVDSHGQVLTATRGQRIRDIPTYCWDRRRFWAETRIIRELRLRKNRHSILGAPVSGAPSSHPQWRNYLRQSELDWLPEHVIDGKVVFPAAAYISMAIEAIISLSSDFKKILLRDVMFKSALTLTSAEAGTETILGLQHAPTSAKSSSNTWYRFSICSFDDKGGTIEHCHGLISTVLGDGAPLRTLEANNGYKQLQSECNARRPRLQFYKRLRDIGLQYGENFQLLSGDIESGRGFAIAPLTFDPARVVSTSADNCIVHPTLLDASFHTIFASIESQMVVPLEEGFVPTFIRSMAVSSLIQNTQNPDTARHFWVRSETTIPGSRVAISQVTIQAERSNEVLVDLQGFEVTALGNDSASGMARRALFFQIRWCPAFDQLGRSSRCLPFTGIAEVMDTFAHQYPDCQILHLTPSVSLTQEVLGYLGVCDGSIRRIRGIHPYSRSKEVFQGQTDLERQFPGLVVFGEPVESGYDVVVISEPVDYDVKPFLRKGGFIIADGTDFDVTDFTEVFRSGRYASFRTSIMDFESKEDLTILVSSDASEKTNALGLSLREIYGGKVDTVSVENLHVSPPPSPNIISLLSLDEDLFFDPQTETPNGFQSIKNLLTAPKKNIIWVLQGASLETSNPAQALMLGLIRTARSENEDSRLLTLDIAKDYNVESTSRRVVQLLARSILEEDVSERDGLLFIPRVEVNEHLNRKLPYERNRQPRLEPFWQHRKLALKIGKVGLLDTLQFEEDDDVMDSDLGDNDIEVKVMASALNFRDIAASIGIIDDYKLGDECSGVVVQTGRNVRESEFKLGDRVVACRPGQGAHRSIVRNPAMLCQKVGDMDFVTAASFEGVLSTAYYSLIDVARVQPGEYCLIHSAAGGVGQMAIQLVQMLGGIVIATVGSQEKRDFLKHQFQIPDEMIFSSRDALFVEGVLKITDGRGCDVALNSLAGELLHATWGCVAPFGRLIEIGKRDIHENSKLDMNPFRKNITYASVDIITLFLLNKPLLARIMRDSYKLVVDGKVIPPSPIMEVSYAEVQRGFRLLQMGKYFGKIVLVPGESDLVPVVPTAYRKMGLFKPDKAYLLVGGLGGIGRALAEWMFRKGARRLAFLSRTGADRDEAKTVMEWLTTRKAAVSLFRGDITEMDVVKGCIQSIGNDLAGVFQAAMVLRDVPFVRMSLKQWQQCVYPKVHGTYNLHMATVGLDLDFFICFSSGAAVLGSIAQANYAAANSYIDALMRHRRESGLPGVTMNVGMVSGVGAVAENDALEKVMQQLGYEPITENELFYQVQEAVDQQNSDGTLIAGLDYHRVITGINLQRKDLYWANKPIFRNLYANLDLENDAVRSRNVTSLATLMQKAKDSEERMNVLLGAFIDKVANVLGVPSTSIVAGNPLSLYGLDSIVAVEFRKWFSKTVGVEVALFDILAAKSIEALVRQINETITSVSMPNTAVTSNHQNLIEKPGGNIRDQTMKRFSTEEFAAVPQAHRIPMSAFQKRVWFLHNLLEDRSALNFTIICYASGQPKITYLEQALAELIQRNDILRTSYFEGEEYAEQTVVQSVTTNIPFTDLSMHSPPEVELEDHANRLRAVPLDIESGQVMRLSLARLSATRYAMMFVFHHIALDNGSTRSAMDQFTALYNTITSGAELSDVAAPRTTYSEFTLWHAQKLTSPHRQGDLKWWKESLHGAPVCSVLLPFAQSQRPDRRSSCRSILKCTLTARLLKRMRRICSQLNVTPFQFLLSAFRAFIFRYTQEDDLTVLMIDGNRPHPALGDVLGFFVNMIPLRLQNACDGGFTDLLEDVKRRVLDSLAHSELPFDVIVDSIHTERTASHFPIGQIAINYQMYGKPPKYQTSDFVIDDVIVEDIPTACEIALEALEDPQVGLHLRLEYDSYLYGEHDMERFFENFMTFTTNIIKDHRQPIDEIDMCGPKELRYLREKCWSIDFGGNEWNNESIVSRVMAVAKERPESIAITTSTWKSITYEALILQASRISFHLQQAGISPGQLVGVLAQPGIDMIAAIVGVVLYRCGYVPLDPSFAKARLTHMLEDSAVSAILAGDEVLDVAGDIAKTGVRTVQVIPISVASSTSEILPLGSPNPHDPFYVMYTSGTTGPPKGVLLTHENTQSMLSSHGSFHGFQPRDTVLSHSSITFDLSVAQIWGALSSGAVLALAALETRQDPTLLARFMREVEVSVTYFPPTQFALLLEHNAEDIRACSRYRRAIFAGEYLPPRLVKAIYDLKTSVSIYNQYGPTETAVQTTSHPVSYPDHLDLDISIGFPLLNCSHYIVDHRLKPVPASVVGEICIGGAQVGQSYLNPHYADKEAFVEDPFASDLFRAQGWRRLYRTGDKARFRADGQIDFRGRLLGDSQVKLRGFRFELGEVENEVHLASKRIGERLPRIMDVAVVVHGCLHDRGALLDERQIIAFLAPIRNCTGSERKDLVDAIQGALAQSLNDYMLPSGYQFQDSLPRLVSGKIDRQTLLQSELDLVFPTSASAVGHKGQNSAREEQEVLNAITETFVKVLNLADTVNVEPTERFFDLGGNSLLIVRLRALLTKRFNVEISIADLFEAPTPLGISQLIVPRLVSSSADEKIDWDCESTLPDSGEYRLRSEASLLPRSQISGVLLTGVDTFSGVHTLEALLCGCPSTTIHVLGTRDEVGIVELCSSFERWQLFSPTIDATELASRTRCIPGTLAEAHFGLSDDDFRLLGYDVQSIYHLGAEVSLLKTYTDLKKTNVGSTLDIIELASYGKQLTEIHYLSTWSVPHLQTWITNRRSHGRVDASEAPPTDYRPAGGNELGYFKSRWVAEMLLNQAAERGFPTNIYRSSSVTSKLTTIPRAAASTGTTIVNPEVPTPEDNFTNNLILDMIALGVVPDLGVLELPFAIDLIPVDYLATTLVLLSTRTPMISTKVEIRPRYYHICNQTPLNLKELPQIIEKIKGYSEVNSLVSPSEYAKRLRERVRDDTEEARRQMEWAVFERYLSLGYTMFSLKMDTTTAALAKIESLGGLSLRDCPPVDETYLRHLFRERPI